jgi:WhiB family redox-sensing transcriptional regulator
MSATDPTPPWMAEAACRGLPSGIFYTDEDGKRSSTVQAKAICGGCPVSKDCLTDAVTRREPHGIWGGMTPSQRERYTATRLAIHTSESVRRYGRQMAS